jgi:putative hydrolase of the HAD superfamily
VSVRFEAVIFDLGGVVLPSPFEAWAEYEDELGVDVGFIRGVVARSGDEGAWARHERGEIGFNDFVRDFEAECSAGGSDDVSGAEVMARLVARPDPRPEMLAAIRAVRDVGLRTGALTNNWAAPEPGARSVDLLADLFDVVVESSVEGLRKPDPRIYTLTCDRLGVVPDRTVFLDDLGVNLKPARTLGMHTIKVVDPVEALRELGAVLGVPLA